MDLKVVEVTTPHQMHMLLECLLRRCLTTTRTHNTCHPHNTIPRLPEGEVGMDGAHPIRVPPSLGGILTPEVLSIMAEEEVVVVEAEVEEVLVEVIRPTLRQLLGSKRPLSSRYVHIFLSFWSLLF